MRWGAGPTFARVWYGCVLAVRLHRCVDTHVWVCDSTSCMQGSDMEVGQPLFAAGWQPPQGLV
jgi:hypothetical protein